MDDETRWNLDLQVAGAAIGVLQQYASPEASFGPDLKDVAEKCLLGFFSKHSIPIPASKATSGD